jgi:hypothetical protein
MAKTSTRDTEQRLLLEATMKGHTPYQYIAIPQQGWIRVLELLPGSGLISCKIKCQRISDEVQPFEALSYVWGEDDPQQKQTIFCDNQALVVGSNLAAALTKLRLEGGTRVLWADAVCINQNDNEEKSSQVVQMGDIYSSAQRVIVWLGEDAEHEAEECFRLLKETVETLDSMIVACDGIDRVPPLSPTAPPIVSGESRWAPLMKLMTNDYMRRTWVLQETGLASAALIQWGDVCINWAYLVEFMLLVALRSDIRARTGILNSGLIWDTFEDLWCTYGNKTTWRDEMPYTSHFPKPDGMNSFISTLNTGRYFATTDPRDHVYAFLSHPSADGAARTWPGKLLLPDYTATVDRAYLDTAVRILETDPHPWTVLSCSDHKIDSASLTGQRPSWVPRWDEGFRVYWLGYPGMWYRAGGTDDTDFQSKFDSDNSLLHVQGGVLFDMIAWVSEPFVSEQLTLLEQKAKKPIQHLWREIQSLTPVTPAYGLNSDENRVAFSLAIVAGRDEADNCAELRLDQHLAAYEAYDCVVTSQDSDSKAASSPGTLALISNQRRALHNRRFFRTLKGYYGIAHRVLGKGDICCVFRGAGVPFVLRRVKANGATSEARYMLVGEAYVQGIMRGEVWPLRDRDEEGMILV